MCILLKQEEKQGGRNKKLQFEIWKQYFNWIKQGHKYIITEIYDNPIIKIDNQGNNIYNTYIEKLVLDLLVQKYESEDEYNKRIYLSKDNMLQSLNMVNTNYHYIKYNIADSANYIKVKSENIKEFYDINNKNFNNSVERALKRLANKFLVNWQFTQTVAVKESDIKDVYDYDDESIKEIHRDATKIEREYIIKYELLMAEEMGFKTKQDIFLCGKYLEFIDRVCNKLREEEFDILYYYTSYDIVFHEKVIEELNNINQYLLDYEERKDVKVTLNGIISSNIVKNTEKRHIEAIEELPPVLGQRRIDKYDYKQATLLRRSNDNYITDNDKIIDTVINHKTRKLIDNIISYNRKEKDRINKDIDNLLYGDE